MNEKNFVEELLNIINNVKINLLENELFHVLICTEKLDRNVINIDLLTGVNINILC